MIDKVKIGGIVYQVKFVEQISGHDYTQEDSRELLGEINYNLCTIEIMKNMDIQKQKQTLIHEIMHGIMNVYKTLYQSKNHEIITESIGNGMYQVMVDNPELLKFIGN